MHDVLAVMEAVGSERAVLVGYSEGVPMALLMAALHPERVRGLVLYAGYARRTRAPDYPWAKSDEEREAYIERLVTSWDWAADVRRRCPSADRAMERWWERRMGAAATPTTVRAVMNMNALVDVRDILPSISAPTLLLHRIGDELFDPRESGYIAERVPGAVLRLLEGRDHLPWGDGDQVLDQVEPFVATLPGVPRPPGAGGGGRGRGRARGRRARCPRAGGGRPRSRVDGTLVVLFDGPATGVRAIRAVLEPGCAVAVGVAIDEVTVAGGPVDGVGVDAAVNLAAAAGPGEIRVAGTAAVLLARCGIVLEQIGGGCRVVSA